LQHRESFLDFGARFAYNDSDAHQGKSSEGEKMAKKTLKKAKKIEATKPLMTLPGKSPRH
jgi:hypothetical protein